MNRAMPPRDRGHHEPDTFRALGIGRIVSCACGLERGVEAHREGHPEESNPDAVLSGWASGRFANLPTNISLVAPSGATSCSALPPGTAYVNFPGELPANGTVNLRVLFLNLDASQIEYAPVVLAGQGGR